MSEKYTNNGESTLNGDIDDDDVSLVVTAAASFPVAGDFRIIIDDEIMLVTGVSGTTFTVTRGAEGTTPASHTSGVGIKHVVTAASLENIILQVSRVGAPLTLTSSDFTIINTSTSTITDTTNAITIRKPTGQGAAENVTILVRSLAAGKTAIGRFRCAMAAQSGNVPCFGLAFRRASSGKIMGLTVNCRPSHGDGYTLSIYKWDSPTAFNATTHGPYPTTVTGDIWLKVQDNATNVLFSISHDGIHWVQFYSESRTTFEASGFDQAGFFANNYNGNYDMLVSLIGWSES